MVSLLWFLASLFIIGLLPIIELLFAAPVASCCVLTFVDSGEHLVPVGDCNSVEAVQIVIHVSGFADLNARTYIALPKGTNINDPYIKQKYNLF